MFRKRQPPPGSAPGAFSVPEHAQPPRIHVFDYTAEQLTEFDVTEDAEKLRPLRDTNTVTWIDIQGLGNESVRRQLMSLRRAVWPIGIAVVMFGYFRHIGWIGQGGKELDDGGRERS